MVSRDELDQVKELLRENIASSDSDNFLKNVEKFLAKAKDVLKPEELAELQELLGTTKKTQRPMPTYHEFVLFSVIMVFLISIFGETQYDFFFESYNPIIF